MKKHLVSIWFETENGDYAYSGFVHGCATDERGRAIVSLQKIFRHCAGFDMPENTTYSTFKPVFNSQKFTR